MLPSLPPDGLRDQVLQTLRKHWVAPQPPQAAALPAPDRLEERSRLVLDTMLTRQFRVGPLPAAAVYEQLLIPVRRAVGRGQPVRVTVGYGPLKNPNNTDYSRADWAEFFALCHLIAWHNKVCSVYPPGLAISIAFDDATLVMANRADKGLMRSYIQSVGRLLQALHYDHLIQASLRHSAFAWLFHFGIYQWARWRVRRWERDPANEELMERMREAAARNVVLPAGLPPAEQDQYIRAASHRYRVYWEALQISRLSHSNSRLIAMYLDGTQHHIRQLDALHLTSLDKGQVTQPWQGPGALLDNGHGKLVPTVLTSGRKQRYALQVVERVDLLPEPGFEQIAVAHPVEALAAPSPATVRPLEKVPVPKP